MTWSSDTRPDTTSLWMTRRILAAVKNAWGERVTTVFPRQGQYANDPTIIAACPPADIAVERIGDLLDCDLSALLAGQQSIKSLRR